MNDEIISAFVGAVLGGSFSIITTLIMMKSELKRQREVDERKFKYQLEINTIPKKEELYLELANTIIPLSHIQVDEEAKYDIDYLDEMISGISHFINNNDGKISLYASEVMQKEIRELRFFISKLYDERPSIITEAGLNSLSELAFQIKKMMIYMQKELGISQPPKTELKVKVNKKTPDVNREDGLKQI